MLIYVLYIFLFILLLSLSYEAIYSLKDKKNKRAYLYLGGILLIIVSIVIYEAGLLKTRVHRLEEPEVSTLMPKHDTIPKALGLFSEYHSDMESAWVYLPPALKENRKGYPRLIIHYINSKHSFKDCSSQLIYKQLQNGPAKRTKIQSALEGEAILFENSSKPHSFTLYFEDSTGCMRISSENLHEVVMQEDLVNILNNLERKQ